MEPIFGQRKQFFAPKTVSRTRQSNIIPYSHATHTNLEPNPQRRSRNMHESCIKVTNIY